MLLLSALFALTAQAAEPVSLTEIFAALKAGEPACYGREYSTEHLEKHPKQTVRSFRAKLVKDATDPDFLNQYIEVEAVLKGEKNYYKLYRSFLVCDPARGECGVECDGGTIKVSGDKEGKLRIENKGFLLEGGCGGEEESDSVELKPTPNGDDVFQLYKLPTEFCQL